MERLLGNLRYAFRSLRKDPAFVIPAVLTLALGIGINTTVFSVVNAILIRPMPHIDTERLVVLRDVQRSQRRDGGVSYPDLSRPRGLESAGQHTVGYRSLSRPGHRHDSPRERRGTDSG